jgi:beta-lactamase class A
MFLGKYRAWAGAGMVALGLGLLGGWLAHGWLAPDLSEEYVSMEPLREGGHEYDFINPLLTCKFPESTELKEYASFEKIVNHHVLELQASGHVEDIAYYYRDLNRGRWVGIREDHEFEPASLFKVPVMMAYFQQSEVLGEVSEEVFELIERMITESDNEALNALLDDLDESALREIFLDLGVAYPGDSGSQVYTISPRKYSLFFRVLYNGTYLRPDLSERALELMSQTTFDHGLTAGLPPDFQVSHKFGERGLYNDHGEVIGYELHDCGIVYDPGHEYFLCIFTKGSDIDYLAHALKELSHLTYTQAALLD